LLLLLAGTVTACEKDDRRASADTPQAEPTVVRIATLKEGGGRLDWSSRNVIAFDQLGADSYYDIYTMNPDGSSERCLTCNRAELPNRHIGNPAWHPSGQFIAFQAQKATAPNNAISDVFATPGSGVNNDLWIMDGEATRFWRLVEVPTGQGAVLHPHFSAQGDRLVWAERLTSQGGPIGQWALKVGDFTVADGAPRLDNVRQYQPGSQRRFYESHGFTPDGRRVLFSGNLESGQSESGMDVYSLDLATGGIANLTGTPAEWDEHAQVSPQGSWVTWVSSMGPGGSTTGPRTDFWMMRPDGSAKRQLTFFNQPGRAEYIAAGAAAADHAWSPDGTKLLGYVILDVARGTARTVLIEFSRPAAGDDTADGRELSAAPGHARATAPLRRASRVHRIAVGERDENELREWDATIDSLARSGRLELIATAPDPLVPGRTHERLAQRHNGVRVIGGQVTRQRGGGKTFSILGTLYSDIDVEVTPLLTAGEAREHLAAHDPSQLPVPPVVSGLAVLPLAEGGSRLVYEARLYTHDAIQACMLDAATGAVVRCDGNLHAPGRSPSAPAGLRDGSTILITQPPSEHGGDAPVIYDMRGSARRTFDVFSRIGALSWLGAFAVEPGGGVDPTAIGIAHHLRATLAYLRLHTGRDPFATLPLIALLHPGGSRAEAPVPLLERDPFYAPPGVLVFPDAVDGLGRVPSLESVAHAVGHALVDVTARFEGHDESGALSEALARSISSGVARASLPGGANMDRPHRLARADQEAKTVAVLTAFELARGHPADPERRETATIDAAFLRALTMMLPAGATLHMARVATLQSVSDLGAAATPLEARLANAWSGVGVPATAGTGDWRSTGSGNARQP
jgi:hypothetical protein